ncbi:hypothetical protein DFJ73DRAFT_765884 [Zopfochytrium polystomum]|nr:hypothetical protein DFJ73DRAFT_765884 [Zopfochytrium polystomum]
MHHHPSSTQQHQQQRSANDEAAPKRQRPRRPRRPGSSSSSSPPPSHSRIAVVRRAPRPPAAPRPCCDAKGLGLVAVVLLAIAYFQLRPPADYRYPRRGIVQRFEFEPATRCLPVEASKAVYPDAGSMALGSQLDKLGLTITGSGVGTLRITFDSQTGNVMVDNHFHLTPNIPSSLVNVTLSAYDNSAFIDVRTPACLAADSCDGHDGGGATVDDDDDDDDDNNDSDEDDHLNRRRYRNPAGCVVVASRLSLPAKLKPTYRLVVAVDGLSIDADLAGRVASVGRVELRSGRGNIRARGLRADAVVLMAANGSVEARDVVAGMANIEAAGGSVTVEKLSIGRHGDIHSDAGAVVVTDASGTFEYLSISTKSGRIAVSNLAMPTPLRAAAAAAAVVATSRSGSISISARNFSGTFHAKGKLAAASGTQLLIGRRTKSEVFGRRRRGEGDEDDDDDGSSRHKLTAVSSSGNVSLEFPG